jgi:hypothetical protein
MLTWKTITCFAYCKNTASKRKGKVSLDAIKGFELSGGPRRIQALSFLFAAELAVKLTVTK